MRRFAVGLAMLSIATMTPWWAFADDQQIAQTIVSRLKEHKEQGDLREFDIDLKVKDGSVWLQGYVSQPEQQRLAEQTTRDVEGVKKVINQLTIRGGKSVASHKKSEVQPTSLHGELKDAEPGAASEGGEKQEAVVQLATESQASAEKPLDVERAYLEEEAVSDERLISRIMERLQALKREGKLRGFGVDVEIEQGVVQLSGRVSSAEQQRLLVEAVRQVKGVKRVVNEVLVQTRPVPLSDPSVASKPEETVALDTQAEAETSSTELVAPSIPVAPADVPLADPAAQPTTPIATPALVAAPPAVTPYVDANDANTIVAEVVRRLKEKQHAGQLSSFNIDVQCDHGSVWLSGHVPSADQAAVVLDTTRRVPGIRQVVNGLTVANSPYGAYMAAPASALMPPAPLPAAVPQARGPQMPLAFARTQGAGGSQAVPAQAMEAIGGGNAPMPLQYTGYGVAPARFDHPQLPGYAWPSYAAYPNYAAVTYPKQYSATAWPYIGPFYPYPQVPLGWRKVTLEWDDGWWMLDFKDH